ncbi:MAG: hypothetical protein ACRCZJ_01440 [Erysipelotrichaceae bacterium]
MMKVTLLCAAGMTTSLLVVKLRHVALSKHIDLQIQAMGQGRVQETCSSDVVLLGPHIHYLLPDVYKAHKNLNTAIALMDKTAFATMNAEVILMQIEELYQKNRGRNHMTRIILACAAGMSTSLLVNKMKEQASAQGLEVSIEAISEATVSAYVDKCDVILLGPQVRFMLDKVSAIAAPHNVPVTVIPMQVYGMMDGAKALAMAMDMVGK